MDDIEKAQRKICEKYKTQYCPPSDNSKLGIAITTIKNVPLNGLRHPVTESTCGWYIWGGTEFSENAEFFSPLHVFHIEEYCPEASSYLGLPAGWRFLIAADFVDVWFDESLLNVK
jgi:hypothetical protein